jgi:hypothetical protein
MEQTLEERKNKYLAYVLDEYAAREKTGAGKYFVSGYELVPTKNYVTKYKKQQPEKIKLVVRHTLLKYVTLFFMGVFIFASAINWARVWYQNLVIFIVLILVSTILAYIKMGKPVMIMSQEYLFLKESGYIKWTNLIFSFFKTYHSDGDIVMHSIIIHYYDEGQDLFKGAEIKLAALDNSPQEMAFYIEKFSGSRGAAINFSGK